MAKKGKGASSPANASGDKVVCQNRKARHRYELGERFEAGLVLQGSEVKSCRAGAANLADAYVRMKNGEAWLVGSHIAPYSHGGYLNHEPERERKLLLGRRELDKIEKAIAERGAVVVPLQMYFKRGWVKVELAVGKGKTHEDRRESVRERETRRELERAMRRGRR